MASRATNKNLTKKNVTLSGYQRFALVVTSLFGAGFAPKAPGTAGSLLALGLVFVPFPPPLMSVSSALLVASIVGFVLGVVLVPTLEKHYGNDPPCVVLDEAVGMWLTVASPLVPHSTVWLIAGFILFRFFDIWKPFPARWLNEQEGSFFVMIDDVAAALYAASILHVMVFVSRHWSY